MPDFSPTFIKARTIAFASITALSFLWIILLCVDIFIRWNATEPLQRSLILVILICNIFTVVLLPVLMLCAFRPWLDAARMLLLITIHLGAAGMDAYWNPRFECPNSTGDQEGICRLLSMYVLLAAWVVPAFLLAYSAGLAAMMYRRTRQPCAESELDLKDDEGDIESQRSSNSPAMLERRRQSLGSTIHFPPMALMKSDHRSSSQSSNQRSSTDPLRKESLVDETSQSRFSTSTAGRLSKTPKGVLAHHF